MKAFLQVPLTILLSFSLFGLGSTAKAPYSSSEVIGLQYVEVVEKFENAKFETIELNEIADLTSDDIASDGLVTAVTIAGNDSFEKREKFDPALIVEITYHVVKTELIPIASSDIQKYDYIELEQLFENAGFTNISVQEVFDLVPNENAEYYENEIAVNSMREFEKNAKVPFDSEIKIICHRPYTIYNVKLIVDCQPNFFFDKYDVLIKIDGNEVHRIPHGETVTYTTSVREGERKVSFVCATAESITHEIAIDVDGDIEASYNIACLSDKIEVEEVYVEHKREPKENEAKVLEHSAQFEGLNIDVAKNKLSESGFTNIELKSYYDNSLGSTSLNTARAVTINGITDFRKGDIFLKDSKVVIKYHTIEEGKLAVPDSASGYRYENYEEVVEILKSAGFKNIETKAEYILTTGLFDKVSVYDIQDISINGNSSFQKNTLFDEDAEVIIVYKDFIMADPSIEFKSVTVDKIFKDIDSNAMKATDTYVGAYVEVSGKLEDIDSHGNDFYLYSSKDKWEFRGVQCKTTTDKQKEQLYDLSAGKKLKVKGQITSINEFGCEMEVYKIK